MIEPQELERRLCSTFCAAIHVAAVPCGYAVSSPFTDRSGDRIGFYCVAEADGYRLEDDGDYLANLVALGFDIETGMRGRLLDAVLQEAGAWWSRDSLEMSTALLREEEIAPRAIAFLSALIRVRDVELLTRDMVRSTFREDALSAIEDRFSAIAAINVNEPIDKDFADYPVDVVIRPKEGRQAAVYFVTTNEHLTEAQLLFTEAERLRRSDISVIALLESYPNPALSRKKFQRAQNRGLTMPIFRGEENASLGRIARELQLQPA